MAQSKATRKFEKNHLKDVIKRRKDFAKIKQRHQMNDKRKAKNAKENERAPAEEDNSRSAQKSKQDAVAYENMNVDDFFQGGFELPDLPPPQDKKKAADTDKLGKRKRGEDARKAADAQSASDSDSESEDDPEAHKKQLEALAEKDPEFHKFLQENDAELLNFEDAGLDEIDGLSESEVEDDGPKKKKQKKDAHGTNEVTKATIKKWTVAMKEQHSLRAMKEVVLAFRAAAHVSDEEDKEYKYSISDPEAYHELLVLALQEVPTVLQHHLPVKESQAGKMYVVYHCPPGSTTNLNPAASLPRPRNTAH